MNTSTGRAYIGIIFVNVMWGLSFIGSKYSMAVGLKPFSLVLLRYAVSTAVLLPVLLKREGRLHIERRDIPPMILSGLFGNTVYFYFELNGLSRTSAATASLILAAIPVFTMLSGVLFHGMRCPVSAWAGAVISLIGVYMVAAGETGGADSLPGILSVLCACVCWVIYMELTDKLVDRYSGLAITCWQSLFGMISLIPLSMTEGVRWTDIPLSGYLTAGLFLGLICSALCYLLYAIAIRELSPVRTAIFINLNPVVAVLGGILLLGEHASILQLAGGAVISASIFMVTSAPPGKR